MFDMILAMPPLACAPPHCHAHSHPPLHPGCTNLKRGELQPVLLNAFRFRSKLSNNFYLKGEAKLCVLCKTVIFHKSLGQRVTNKSRGRSAGECDFYLVVSGGRRWRRQAGQACWSLSVYNYMVQLSRRKTNK